MVTHLSEDCPSCGGSGIVYESRPGGAEALDCDCPCHDEAEQEPDEGE